MNIINAIRAIPWPCGATLYGVILGKLTGYLTIIKRSLQLLLNLL